MLRHFRHIAFDLDGTLVHTKPEYRYAVVPRVVEQFAGKTPSQRAIDRFWFEGNRNEVIREEFGIDPAAFWRCYRTVDLPEKRREHTRAYDDAEPVLRALKAHGKIISIITGAPHWIAQMEIERLNGAHYDYYHSITDGPFREKPDPASFFFVLQKLGVRPEDTVYVGNASEDAAFARNAGAAFICIERREHDFSKEEYALATVHSLADLLPARTEG